MINVNEPLDGAIQTETWFWDCDFCHVLGCVEGAMGDWLVEKGVLRIEDDKADGVRDLLEGDVVYRIRKSKAFEMGEDPRERLFMWVTVNPETGVETPRPF